MTTAPTRPVPALRAARVAVAVVFALNGFAFSNWVPRIPEVKATLGLSDGALGGALLGAGLGALVASVVAGRMVARYGSRPVTLWSALALCAVLALPGLAPSWLGLLLALVAVGAADAVMDVAMNAHGVVVERRYGRSIMNGLHGLWSAGAALGALCGGVAVVLGVPVAVHLALVGLALAVVGLLAVRALLPTAVDRAARGGGPGDLVGAGGPGAPSDATPGPLGATGGGLVLTRAVGLLGFLALLAALVEGAPADWSAVYVTGTVGAAAGLAGAPYTALAVAMLVGRLLADRATSRWGAVPVARFGALAAAAGMALGLLGGTPLTTVAGYAVVGAGVCSLFPAVFSAAGHLPGLPPGAAIATVSLVARAGFLVGPPLIGATAELVGLRGALGLTVVASVAIVVLAGGLAPAERTRPPA